MVAGIHPRIGSMKAISVTRLRQQARGSGSRYTWDENGRWVERENEVEVPELPTRNASGREGDVMLMSGNIGEKRKSTADQRASYVAYSIPEWAGA
jgi:hypothetical protein